MLKVLDLFSGIGGLGNAASPAVVAVFAKTIKQHSDQLEAIANS